jgi:hypothetical protein
MAFTQRSEYMQIQLRLRTWDLKLTVSTAFYKQLGNRELKSIRFVGSENLKDILIYGGDHSSQLGISRVLKFFSRFQF